MENMQAKYQIDTAQNREFLRINAENLLSFGHRFPSPGGGSYYLGDDGTPWKDRPRETWITSRMCHVYSIGTFLGHPGSGNRRTQGSFPSSRRGFCGGLQKQHQEGAASVYH